jgi:hypothetical protein
MNNFFTHKHSKFTIVFLPILLLVLSSKAQTKFPCNGDFLFTRQISPSPNTLVSKVNFIPGDIFISNPDSISPAVNTNATVQYGGYIWTQKWNAASFTLTRVAADYTGTDFAVAGMPVANFNNAGVDKNGIMYILENANAPVKIYAINLSSGTPAVVAGFPKTITGFVAGESTIWGDITIDPVTGKMYCWYHPNPAATSNLRGLYEITNITGASPAVTKVGATGQDYIMGSLFFNERGQLFGYGSATVTTGSLQDRFYAIDKANGLATQYGLPDSAVSQSDGCECAFRISLDRQVSVPMLNIPKCTIDTFTYTFTVNNYTSTAPTAITFSDTLDIRLAYAFNAATLQTTLRAIYSASATVTLSSYGGGVNNVVNVTGMTLPLGATSFVLPVRIDAVSNPSSFIAYEQAYLKGIDPILGGPNEPSNDPTTFNPKDGTPIAINLTGTRCLPPVANNFINNPMPQGNAATALPALTGADPDGTVVSYRIKTLPPAGNGVLSIPCPAIPTGAACTGGFASLTAAVLTANPAGIVLTPAQAAAMRFDPANNFSGNATFTFDVTDNSGNVSNAATYIIPVTTQPPVSNNLMENPIVNSNGPTAIVPLNSADVDGTISSYQITSLPTPAQGVLSVPCPPTLTGATCVAGRQNLTAAILAGYPAGIPLTPAQMTALQFDPTAGYLGNAMFNYNAVDNSGNTSNLANYTIPVVAIAGYERPPLADNVTAQPVNNSLGATAIPPLRAQDLDGVVVSYTITSVPTAAQGILSVSCPATPAGATCTGGFANLTAAVLTANPGGIVLTPSQINSLRFDPTSGYIGTAFFSYTATDDDGMVGNAASYTIPIVNTPPTAVNINTIVPFNAAATAVPPITGSDADGTVAGYTLTSVPTAAQGVISISCPATPTGATCTGGFADLTPAVLAASPGGIVLTPAQAASVRFDPATGYSGTLSFNYTSFDNNNNVSMPAVYNISIANQAPVSKDITTAVMPNTSGPTAISALSAADPDGTIASYSVLSIPPPTSGTISIPCPPTPTGATCTGGFANITTAVLTANPGGIILTATQMAGMRFDPAANYTGVVNFTYNATDNSGNVSNVSNYNIPISGVGNISPVAQNILNSPMPNTNAATAIPALSGSDPDGTIISYTITSLPPATQGVLSITCPATPAGATCTGGFANLTAAVLTANPGGIVLTPAQAAALRFDPAAGFAGTAVFTYFDTDNSNAKSNTGVYSLPVTGAAPVANPIIAPAVLQSAGPAVIPNMVASDPDGTIAFYNIETVPPVSQGVLSVPCPPTFTGATCTGGFQDLTAAVLANYPNGGIPLTPTQMAGLRFDPAGSYSGNVVFNYHATDNSGLYSNSTTYIIPVTGLPPVSSDITAPKLLNTGVATPMPALASNDPDGTISSYVINSVPPVAQGVLSIPCAPTPTGATCTGGFADLTAAVLAANPGGIVLNATQMAGIRFDPDPTFIGDVIFNYSAFDNNGNISNTATYLIPVGTAAAFPLGVIRFSGVRKGNDIALQWHTEHESNLNRYEIEYSTNGFTYAKGGWVPAQNLSVNDYRFTLAGYVNSVYYIRLKIMGNGGEFHYSEVVVIRNVVVGNRLSVYPLPAKDFVHIELSGETAGDYRLELVNAAGQTVAVQLLQNRQPGQLITLSRGNLPAGVYAVKITNTVKGQTHIAKLVFE